MKVRSLIIATMTLALGGFVRANVPVVETHVECSAACPGDASHGWDAYESDNICGIHNLKRVTKPAIVNYEDLLAATPQIQEIDRKGIDPESAEGRALRKGARTLITKTCEAVRLVEGYCSVWKVIAHKDGRLIPNITGSVIERL